MTNVDAFPPWRRAALVVVRRGCQEIIRPRPRRCGPSSPAPVPRGAWPRRWGSAWPPRSRQPRRERPPPNSSGKWPFPRGLAVSALHGLEGDLKPRAPLEDCGGAAPFAPARDNPSQTGAVGDGDATSLPCGAGQGQRLRPPSAAPGPGAAAPASAARPAMGDAGCPPPLLPAVTESCAGGARLRQLKRAGACSPRPPPSCALLLFPRTFQCIFSPFLC